MAGLKYSKQRASIKDYLMHTTSHPTADTVYLHIKEEFPNISLGTVYRNLNLLADIGEALRIPTPDGGDRCGLSATRQTGEGSRNNGCRENQCGINPRTAS